MMCPDHELLSAFIDGEVTQPWKGKLESHLQTCINCRQFISSLQKLSQALHTDQEPDYAASMVRVQKAIIQGPRILKFEPTPFWKKQLRIPVPLAAAAASLFIFLSAFLGISLATPAPGLAELEKPVSIAELDTLQDDDLATIIKLMENKDFSNEVLIHLPDDSEFLMSGEPRIIRASDLNRR